MALAWTAQLDRSSVTPAGGRANLVLVLEGRAEAARGERERAPSWTVLALDVSHSMAGDPLAHVVRSVDLLVDALAAGDHLGVVAFSDRATEVAPVVPVDAEGKRLVRSRVSRLRPDGRTNVEDGLETSARMLAAAPPGTRRSIVLLSDGVPNVGASTVEELRAVVRRHRPGTSIASLGYGLDHQEDVLSAVGEEGGGGYELVADPSTCARSFARVLGAQADVVAAGIEVVVAPAPGVTVERLVSGEALRFSRAGVVVAVPDLVAGARAVIVLEVSIAAPGDVFLAPVADVAVREAARAETRHESLTIEVSHAVPRIVDHASAEVLLVRAERARAEARAMADRRQFGGAVAHLRAIMAEVALHPSYRAGDGSPLSETYELLLDEATAMERMPDPEQWSAFRKGAVASKLSEAGEGAPRSRARGDASSRLLDLAAGKAPSAYVEILEGPGVGTRFTLAAESVIGRTASADIALASAEVSRRHAEIYALEGKFFLADLGSTRPTYVNGVRLGTSPHPLATGDVLRVGEVSLRYVALP